MTTENVKLQLNIRVCFEKNHMSTPSHAYRYSIVYMCKHSLYEQNGRSKLFNLDFVWVTLEYGLFFLNCYE